MGHQRNIEKQKEILSKQTTMELHVILNKYCSWDSIILCKKKYGITFDKTLVEEEIMDRVLLGEISKP